MLSAAFKFYGIFKENSADLSGYSVMNNNITLVKYSLLQINALKKEKDTSKLDARQQTDLRLV